MPFSNEQVFQLTKILYKEVKQNFTENYIGQKQSLQQFQQNYIQPLYPAKKIQDEHPPDQTIRGKISQYRHKYDQQIEFSDGQTVESEQSEESSSVSYVAAVEKYSLRDLICKLRVGRFFCWSSTPPDHVYEDLGLGVCLYLKFMKHFVYVLLLLAVLSAITMSINYEVAQSNKYQPGLNYQKILFSMGVGSLSLEGIKCIHENITSTAIEFDLACPVGYVRVLGPVYTESKFETLQTCKKDIIAHVDQDQDLFMSPNNYYHQTNCNEQLSNCTYNVTVASPNQKYEQISVTYECINGKNTYGATSITRSTALYLTVVFDLILIVSLMLFFWSQASAEKNEEKYFKEKQILLNAFTLEIGSFSKRNFNQQFTDFLEDLEKQIKKEDNLQINLRKCIIQVRLPDNDQYDRDQAKREDAYRDIYGFIGDYFIEKDIDPNAYDSGDDFKKGVFRSEGAFKSYRRKLGELIKNYRNMQKLKGKNQEEQLKIYVVFLKPKYKRLIMQKTRLILGQQIIETSKKDYEIIDPPAPSLILWDNIGKNKLVRGIISWTLSLLILLGTYVLTAYILSLQDTSVKSQYDYNIECQNVFPDENYGDFNEQYYEQYQLSYTHCYCLNRSIIFSLNFEEVCAQWRDQYTLYLAVPVLYGLGLFIMNEIVSSIYRRLSQLQAHQYLTSQLYSYIIKQTILETTDLALVIVLLSIDFNKKSNAFDFLLIGSYDDLSADWHLQVGIIIIVNMFFNMFSPFIEGIFYLGEAIVTKIKLCFFHKKDKYNKTKMNYIEYYRENVFPIEERYASILAVLFISLALNCIYPIMTVIMAVTLLLYQLMDKLMIIKVYNKPLNFQGLLQKKIMKVFLIILLIHIIITAIFLTEPFLIVAGRVSGQASIADQHSSRIANMFNVGYVIPYMILLVVIVVSVIVIFVSDHFLITKPNPRVRLGLGGIPFEENKFYNLLDAYELDRTIALKRREIQRNKILEKKYMKKATDQDDQLRHTNSNEPMVPTKRRDLILSSNKPILSEISQYSYYRLLKKKLKTTKEQQKLVKLAGMTAYEWEEDWIYFDEEVRLDYKVPEIDSYLNELAKQAESRVELIKSIIEMAREKRRAESNDKEEIMQVDNEIKEERDFEEIIANSHVTSVEEKDDNPLDIQDTSLPILALEKQLQSIREEKNNLKASNQGIRASARMERKNSYRDNMELRGSNNGRNLEKEGSVNSDQSKKNSQRMNPKQLKQITEIKEDQNETIHENEIRLKILDSHWLLDRLRLGKTPSQTSSQHDVNKDFDLSQKSDDKGKNPEDRKKRRFIQGQKDEEQRSIADDIHNMSQDESKILNSSQQEDNEIEKVIEPVAEQSQDRLMPMAMLEKNINSESLTSSRQEQQKHEQESLSNNKNPFYLNDLPSEKILLSNDKNKKKKESESQRSARSPRMRKSFTRDD